MVFGAAYWHLPYVLLFRVFFVSEMPEYRGLKQDDRPLENTLGSIVNLNLKP